MSKIMVDGIEIETERKEKLLIIDEDIQTILDSVIQEEGKIHESLHILIKEVHKMNDSFKLFMNEFNHYRELITTRLNDV